MSNPTHPIHPVTTYKADGDEVKTETFTGLSKREYFAAMAMQGMINNVNSDKFIASAAVALADELLKQLENDTTGTS